MTAHHYGFGTDAFLIEVFNDPIGVTYKDRISLDFMTDAEIATIDEGKRRCYGVVCAAGVAAESIAIGNIADANLARNSVDRQLLARFTPLPLEKFIEEAKVLIGANRELRRRIAKHFERKFWEFESAHRDTPDGLFTVMNKAEIDARFIEVKAAAR